MISYAKFKEIFDALDAGREPEIELYFQSRDHTYMIIKYSDFITFQRCGTIEEQSGEIRFISLDELYNARTIDGIVLKNEWGDLYDILFDCTFSVINDPDEIHTQYGVCI